jgi:hypothetical protein
VFLAEEAVVVVAVVGQLLAEWAVLELEAR